LNSQRSNIKFLSVKIYLYLYFKWMIEFIKSLRYLSWRYTYEWYKIFSIYNNQKLCILRLFHLVINFLENLKLCKRHSIKYLYFYSCIHTWTHIHTCTCTYACTSGTAVTLVFRDWMLLPGKSWGGSRCATGREPRLREKHPLSAEQWTWVGCSEWCSSLFSSSIPS
jgi:hypothetical protein